MCSTPPSPPPLPIFVIWATGFGRPKWNFQKWKMKIRNLNSKIQIVSVAIWLPKSKHGHSVYCEDDFLQAAAWVWHSEGLRDAHPCNDTLSGTNLWSASWGSFLSPWQQRWGRARGSGGILQGVSLLLGEALPGHKALWQGNFLRWLHNLHLLLGQALLLLSVLQAAWWGLVGVLHLSSESSWFDVCLPWRSAVEWREMYNFVSSLITLICLKFQTRRQSTWTALKGPSIFVKKSSSTEMCLKHEIILAKQKWKLFCTV